MGSFGKGAPAATNQVSTTRPDPATAERLYNFQSQAAGVAATPFQAPVAPVAGFSPDQLSAFQGVRGVQGQYQPFIDAAAGYAGMGGAPAYQTMQNYYNPFQQQVINATMDKAKEVQGQQQQGLTSQLIGAPGGPSAWGGDRAAVAKAALQGQHDIANNATLAGLNSQMFNTALGAANTDANRAAQTAYTFGSLGQEQQNLGLSGYGALLNTGGLQQQLQQAQMNAPYQWELQREAYPFQTASWLSGIYGQTSPLLGSTTTQSGTQTPPGPSPMSQMVGLGTFGLGAYNAYNSPTRTSARGGRIGYDYGGIVPEPYNGPSEFPHPAEFAKQGQGNSGQSGGGLSDLLGAGKALGSGFKSLFGGSSAGAGEAAAESLVPLEVEGGDLLMEAAPLLLLRSGGRIGYAPGGAPGSATSGGVMPFWATASSIVPAAYTGAGRAPAAAPALKFLSAPDANNDPMKQAKAMLPAIQGLGAQNRAQDLKGSGDELGMTYQSGRMVPTYGAPTNVDANDWARGGRAHFDIGGYAQRGYDEGTREEPDFSVADPGSFSAPSGIADARNALRQRGMADVAMRSGMGDYEDPEELPGNATPTEGTGVHPLLAPSPGVSPIEDAESGDAGSGDAGTKAEGQAGVGIPKNPSLSQALMAAGLGIMGGTSRYPLVNIGQGGLKGVENWKQQEQELRQQAAQESLAKYREQQAALRAAQINRQLLTERQKIAEAARYHDLLAEQRKFQSLLPRVISEDKFGHKTYGVQDPNNPGNYIPITVNGKPLGPSQPLPRQPQPASPAVPDGVEPVGPTNAGEPIKLAMNDQGLPDSELPYSNEPKGSKAFEVQEKYKAAAIDRNNKIIPQAVSNIQRIVDEDRVPPPDKVHPEVLEQNPDWANTIKAIAENRGTIGRNFDAKTRSRIYQLVRDYYPEWDEGQFARRNRTINAFAAGPDGRNVTALNTVMGHARDLFDSSKDLGNFATDRFGIANKKLNEWRTWMMENKQDPRIVRFKTAANAVANELEKAFRGQQTAIAGVKEWKEKLSPSMSPEEMRASMSTLMKLLGERISAVGNQYSLGMGKARDGMDFLTPENRKIFDTLKSGEIKAPNAGSMAVGETTIRNGYEYQKQPDGSMKPIRKVQ